MKIRFSILNRLQLRGSVHPEYAEVEVLLGMKLPQRTVSTTLGQPKTDADGEVIEYVELVFGTPNLNG